MNTQTPLGANRLPHALVVAPRESTWALASAIEEASSALRVRFHPTRGTQVMDMPGAYTHLMEAANTLSRQHLKGDVDAATVEVHAMRAAMSALTMLVAIRAQRAPKELGQ